SDTEVETTDYLYENQRWFMHRWASPYLPKDPTHWSDVNGNFKTQGMVNKSIPNDWEWTKDWQIDVNQHTNKNGWAYAPEFGGIIWHPKRSHLLHQVRRRKWYRTRVRSKPLSSLKNAVQSVKGAPTPGQFAMSPRMSMSMAGDEEVQTTESLADVEESSEMKPLLVSYCNRFEIAWSTANVIEASGYQCSVWKPVLADDEYCLGYLVTPERNFPVNTFLVTVKEGGLDKDAFARPIGFEMKWSTKFMESSAKVDGFGGFYKPKPPQGYVSLGDVAIFKKSGSVSLDDFPKVVCIKAEYIEVVMRSGF
ncbi:galectin, partial [Reticulomyxa filosa]